MTGIIVTGHGTFPEGILSAVSLVAGKPDNTQAVNFEMGQSSEDLKDSMAKAMESLEGDEVLILADLVGGTPFNTAAALRKARADKRIKVIAGVNMAARVLQTYVWVGRTGGGAAVSRQGRPAGFGCPGQRRGSTGI